MDGERLHAFGRRFVLDLGTALHLATVVVGDRLGLYEAMADGRPVTGEVLAERTGTSVRYVTEWLAGQAAAGYVDYADGLFRLPPEHAALLVDPGGKPLIPGGFQLAASTIKDEPMITDAFRTGATVGWHEHHTDLFAGSERLAHARYGGHLVGTWLPALDGVVALLESGSTVADVGCGRGATTLLMADAYPSSTFVGYDHHAPSVEWARRAAAQAGLAARVRFEVTGAQIVGAQRVPVAGFGLVTSFGCLHESADAVGVAAGIRAALGPGGVWMMVEPYAGDRFEDNLTPVGKIYYNVSTMICTPSGRCPDADRTVGVQAGESRLRAVVERAGFRRFRRVAETGMDIAYEVRW